MTPDLINGLFEMFGGVLIFVNCWILYKDKDVKGVSPLVVIFFTSWGYWNCYYYPALNQWISFFGGLLIAIANTLWVMMALYYKYRSRTSFAGV